MNKLFTFLASAALISLSACSSDDPAVKGPDKPMGDAAYLNVKIMGVDNGMSRTTTDGNFEYGESTENAVKEAKFFFFYEDGNFADVEATLVENPTFGEGTQDNVELIGKDNVIVINAIQKTDKYPTYMLTILNLPDDFTPGATLAETLTKTTKWNNEGKHVMSTTSYYKENVEDLHHDDRYYFVTKLDKDEFCPSLEAALKATPVDVYVERLSAKVTLGISMAPYKTITTPYKYTPKNKEEKVYNNYTIYKLEQTVGGETNPGSNPGTDTHAEGTEGTGSTVTGTPLYIHVLDWELGGTNPTSYMSKNIASLNDWSAFKAPLWSVTSWNDNNNFRSYWAKSTIYDKVVTDLTYPKSNTLIGLDKPSYCNENTNKETRIFVTNDNNKETGIVNPDKVTHATIHARVCKEDGTPITMIMANGTLYEIDKYKQKILSLYKAKKGNIGIYVGNGKTAIDKTYFEQEKIDVNEVGHVNIKFNFKEGETYYRIDETVTDPEESKFKQLTAAEIEAKKTEINTNLIDVQNEFLGTVRATIYDGGHFVYYVPIEHFGAKAGNDQVAEGYYGVVRNHWYKLDITEFTKVGHGIWNPENYEEVLEPDGPKEYYYLGARINILSWKIVNQNVKL